MAGVTFVLVKGGASMFWEILLAHLLADFVLQPNWMNRRKNKVAVLILHGSVFWGLSLLFLWQPAVPAAGRLLALSAAARDDLK